MPKHRLLIYVEGGVVQDVLTPDNPEHFDVIIKDVDNDSQDDRLVTWAPVGAMTREEWKRHVKLADTEDYEPEEKEDA